MAVRNRLVKLISDKQVRENRIITVGQLSKEAGIPRQTLYQYLNDSLIFESFNASVIERLCRYFEIGVGDLLYIDNTNHQTEAHP